MIVRLQAVLQHRPAPPGTKGCPTFCLSCVSSSAVGDGALPFPNFFGNFLHTCCYGADICCPLCSQAKTCCPTPNRSVNLAHVNLIVCIIFDVTSRLCA